ncbi:hypothetical protein LCGC14_0476440 [marine sediment metagenome]|uniref:Uncharacterized protein n=1 Tax=marine sediment metagenome TaxID=412755 RepID=A0A0F9UXL8_9ZZZZ
MAEPKLKSYRLKFKKKKKMKRRRTATGDIIIGGVTALMGVGLLSATADAVSRV